MDMLANMQGHKIGMKLQIAEHEPRNQQIWGETGEIANQQGAAEKGPNHNLPDFLTYDPSQFRRFRRVIPHDFAPSWPLGPEPAPSRPRTISTMRMIRITIRGELSTTALSYRQWPDSLYWANGSILRGPKLMSC